MPHPTRLTFLCLLLGFCLFGCSEGPTDSPWSSAFTQVGSVSGRVTAVGFMGGDLYVGGEFTTAGGRQIEHAARWNGSEWSKVGSGLYHYASVLSMATVDGKLYIGGNRLFREELEPPGGLVQWDGVNLSPVASSVNITVDDITGSNDTVYYLGSRYVTRQTSSGSHKIYNELPDDHEILSLAVIGDTVFVGFMPFMDGPSVVQMTTGGKWTTIGGFLDNADGGAGIPELIVASGRLYAAGSFSRVNGESHSSTGIAQWDGTKWVGVGTLSVEEMITDMAADTSGNLYAAAGSRLYKWNGKVWRTLAQVSGGDNSTIDAVATDGKRIAIGGDFTSVDGKPAYYVAITQ